MPESISPDLLARCLALRTDDDALDCLFAEVDEALYAGHDAQKWPDIEALLADPLWSEASTTLLIGALSITLPVRDKIVGRDRIANVVRQRNPVRWSSLLQGLFEFPPGSP